MIKNIVLSTPGMSVVRVCPDGIYSHKKENLSELSLHNAMVLGF